MRPSWRSRLVPEVVRSWGTVVGSLVLGILCVVVLARLGGIDEGSATFTAGLIVGILLAAGYSVLTLAAFSGLSGAELYDELTRSVPRRRWVSRVTGGGAASWSVQFSVAALVVGVALALGVDRVEDSLSVVLGIALVLVSWVTVLATYTLHYALMDAGVGSWAGDAGVGGCFRFPGEGPRSFGDYVYLSVHVSTAFSTGDVTVLDSRARRSVTTQAVIAFSFNAVIVALVVAVLVNI